MTPARKDPDQTTYPGRFAARLRELRIKAGLSQTELAEKLNVSQNSITSWETARTAPSLGAYPRLAQALGLRKIRDLFPNE